MLNCLVAGKFKAGPVAFQPNLLLHAELSSPEFVTRQSLKKLRIPIQNNSQFDATLRRGEILGTIQQVKEVSELWGKMCPTQNIDCSQVAVSETPPEDWMPPVDLSHLTEEQRIKAEQLIVKYKQCFARDEFDIGNIESLQMKINLKDEVPFNKPYRKIPAQLYTEVKEFLNTLLMNGFIQKSQSPYASPIVCVRKSCGGLRLCVDYRELNQRTIPDRMPIPRINDVIENLGGKRWFSTLDLTKAYHQGFVHEDSRKFTAFATPWALYEWVRIPMGLTNSPPVFQRKVNEIMEDLLHQICAVYLDDVLAYSKTFDEHLSDLEQILVRMATHHMKLNPLKCKIFKNEVKYLGKIISSEGYHDDPAKTEVIEKLKDPPTTVKELRKLLGFVGYYRTSIPNFARLAKPMYDLLVKPKDQGKGHKSPNEKVIWSEELQSRLLKLLEYLVSPVVMAYPDFEKPFVLHCDASEDGLGSVLYQENDQLLLKVIAYASRCLSPSEKNYKLHSGKLEFLALKWSVCDKFRPYLYYSPSFTVFSDNNPLSYVLTTAKLNATGIRWVGELADFNFKVKYRPGKDSSDCDFMSRHPKLEEFTESLDLDEVMSILSSSSNEIAWINHIHAEEGKVITPTYADIQVIQVKDLKAAQLRDANIFKVYETVLQGNKPRVKIMKQWPKKSRQLMRYFQKLRIDDKGILLKKAGNTHQIVLPTELYKVVYEELHENMGHLGSQRVIDLARERFFWPGMAKDIEEYISRRCRCVKDKKPVMPEKAKLVNIQSTAPFEIVTTDFLHLDKCRGGYEYLLVVTDHFTRFAQVFPTKNKRAKSAADKIFNEIVPNFGFPQQIHHDKGGEFVNKIWQSLQTVAGIKASNTTPYHPMGNGQCERMNRTLINMLKTLDQYKKSNWKDHVKHLVWAYNNTKHKATGYSPHFLMFGRNAKLPIDMMFEGKEETQHQSYGGYVDAWTSSMREAAKLAKENAEKVAKQGKKHYDQKVRCSFIKVGDRVLVRNLTPRGGTGKLRSYWEEKVHVVVDKRDDIPIYS
uniref:Uncharacterized protein n=1 Tax=Clytia hemisphaerica TaxID=252671 RepID=A0A7M5XBV7_9CNID